jgi:uncharacterized membrane protein (UPF0127 family)
LAVFLLLLIILASPEPLRAGQSPVDFEKDTVTLETAAGERVVFAVEIARSREQLMQGLMYRRSMAPNAGMLFLYERPRRVAMWMKNTLIPLDILFLDRMGRVQYLHERAIPGSLQSIGPEGKVAAVLEVNGGTVKRLGIAEGDRIDHPFFEKDY